MYSLTLVPDTSISNLTDSLTNKFLEALDVCYGRYAERVCIIAPIHSDGTVLYTVRVDFIVTVSLPNSDSTITNTASLSMALSVDSELTEISDSDIDTLINGCGRKLSEMIESSLKDLLVDTCTLTLVRKEQPDIATLRSTLQSAFVKDNEETSYSVIVLKSNNTLYQLRMDKVIYTIQSVDDSRSLEHSSIDPRYFTKMEKKDQDTVQVFKDTLLAAVVGADDDVVENVNVFLEQHAANVTTIQTYDL